MALDESLVGTTFADYEIRKCLGWGAQGAVYRAYEKSLRRDVALKLMASDAAHDEALKNRFLEEGFALARLDSPNVVRVHRAGDFHGRLFLSMELVPGISLKDRLAERPLSVEEARKWLRELTCALAVVHAAGIVHRDLKPSNIMIRDSGEPSRPGAVKLIDFGIARATERSLDLTLGSLIGTAYYLSPEQCDPQQVSNQVDARSDIYSLGVVLFEIFTGRLPFESTAFTGIVIKHLFEPPPMPSSLPGVHQSIDSVVMRCLAKRSDERPPTATDVWHLLDRALAQIETDGWTAVRQAAAVSAASEPVRETTESLPPVSMPAVALGAEPLGEEALAKALNNESERTAGWGESRSKTVPQVVNSGRAPGGSASPASLMVNEPAGRPAELRSKGPFERPTHHYQAAIESPKNPSEERRAPMSSWFRRPSRLASSATAHTRTDSIRDGDDEASPTAKLSAADSGVAGYVAVAAGGSPDEDLPAHVPSRRPNVLLVFPLLGVVVVLIVVSWRKEKRPTPDTDPAPTTLSSEGHGRQAPAPPPRPAEDTGKAKQEESVNSRVNHPAIVKRTTAPSLGVQARGRATRAESPVAPSGGLDADRKTRGTEPTTSAAAYSPRGAQASETVVPSWRAGPDLQPARLTGALTPPSLAMPTAPASPPAEAVQGAVSARETAAGHAVTPILAAVKHFIGADLDRYCHRTLFAHIEMQSILTRWKEKSGSTWPWNRNSIEELQRPLAVAQKETPACNARRIWMFELLEYIQARGWSLMTTEERATWGESDLVRFGQGKCIVNVDPKPHLIEGGIESDVNDDEVNDGERIEARIERSVRFTQCLRGHLTAYAELSVPMKKLLAMLESRVESAQQR
jgi:serine/threonine protein kinase